MANLVEEIFTAAAQAPAGARRLYAEAWALISRAETMAAAATAPARTATAARGRPRGSTTQTAKAVTPAAESSGRTALLSLVTAYPNSTRDQLVGRSAGKWNAGQIGSMLKQLITVGAVRQEGECYTATGQPLAMPTRRPRGRPATRRAA